MDEPIVADQQPIAQPPKASPAEKLYDLLNKDGYSEQQLGKKDQFLKAVQNPIAANKLYSGLRTDGYSEQQIGSLKDFQTAVGAKKKEGTIPVLPNGLDLSQGGLNPSQSSPYSNITTTPQMQQQLIARGNAQSRSDVGNQNYIDNTFNKYPGLSKIINKSDYTAQDATGQMQDVLNKNKYKLEFIPKGEDNYIANKDVVPLSGNDKNRIFVNPKMLNEADRQSGVDLDLISHGLSKSADYKRFEKDLESKLISKYGKKMVDGNDGVAGYVRGYLSDSPEYQSYKNELNFLPKGYFKPLDDLLGKTTNTSNAFPDGTPIPAKDAPNTSKPLQFGTPNDQNFNIDKNPLVNQAPTTNDLISHQSNKKIAADQQDKQTRDLFKNPDFLKDLKGNQDIVNNHLKAQLNDEGSQYYKDKAADEEKNAYKGTITLGDRAAALNNSIYNGIGNYGKGLIRAAGTILKSITPDSMGDSWDKAQNDLTGTIDKGVDLATDKLDPAKEAEINKGPINGMVNSLANFVPAIVDAERTGGMSFFFNDYEKGYEDITKQAENSVEDVSEGKKQAFATVRGITSALLMSHNLHSLLGNASEATTDKLLNTVTTGAIDDLYKSGADFTHEATGQAVKGRLDILEDKVKNLGVKALKGSLISAGDMAAFETANIGAEHLINTVTGKQVFDTSNDAERVQQALKGGLALGIVGSLAHAPLLLAKGTEERGSVIESLYKDPSQGNADRIKNAVQEHLQANGIGQSDIDGTIEKVDQLHQIVKTLPKGLSPEKQLKVSELLIDRKHLEKQQADTNAENEAKDPVFSDQHENQAQVYQDRIDGTNDKIKSIVADKPLKYFRDEEGQPMKQFGEEEPEKITEDRYYSEKPNSLFKNEPENVQNNESFVNSEQNKDSLTNNPNKNESTSEKGGEEISPETESGQKEAQLPTEKEVVNPDGDKKPSDTTKDDLAEPEFSNPKEADRHWVEHETDPNEIAARYHTEENFANTKQKAIIDYLGNSKINERDYNRWGDSKRLGGSTDPKRLRWIDSKNSDDTGLDVHAEILSHEIGQQVTPEDIIDVVDHYKGKQHFNEENKTDTQRALEQRYEDLTGNKLTSKRAEKAFEGKLKLTTPETKEADKLLQEVHNINLKDYEQSERNQSSEGGSPASTDEKSTQRPEDDSNGTLGENRQGETAQGEETTTKPKISEKAKTLADKIRSLKSGKKLNDASLGIPTAIWDGALETAATIIEQGGKLADAIQAAVEHIRDKSDQKDEDKIRKALTESLNEAGISDIEPKQDKNPLGLTDPEMIEANNAYMDAKIAGKFGTEVLDAMISKLQDTSLKNIIDKVKEKIKASPEFLSKVRKRVMENQSGNEEDAAALLMDQYHLKGQEEALMKQINEETDPAKLADLQKQLSKTLDDISDNAMANRALGRSASTIFRFRQVAIDQSANLHDMRQQFMASEGVKSLTPEQEEHIKKQYQAIKEAEQALKEAREEHQKTLTENERLQAENDALKKIINDAKQKHSDKTVTTADALTRIRKDLDGSKQRLKELVFGHTNSLGILHPEIYKELKNIVAKKAEEIYVKTKASIDLNKLVKHVLDEIKDVAPDITERDIRDAISGNHEGIKRKPKTELQKNIAELKRQAKIIQHYQDYIDGGDEPKRISKEDKAMLDQLREERKSHADDLDAKAWNVRKYKQTLRSIKDIEGKIDRKEYTLPGKEAKKFDKSKKLIDAEYTLALRKFQWEKERRLALLKNRPLIEKIADVILSLQRFNALSHVTTLVKLAGAVTDATLLFPFRLVIQHITAKMSPKSMVGIISGKVRRQSIAAYYSDFVERVQWKNIKQQLQGVDHADIMYGHPYYGESDGIGNKTKILSWTNNFLQMPGRIHGIEKSFLKYPEKAFARKQLMMGYLEKYNEIQKQLQDKSLSPADQVKLENDLAFYDLSNDDVMNRVESLATAHGNWSIFMQKNHFTDGVGNFFRQKGILGALMKSEIPIIKIPANWANRYFLMQAGFIQAFTGKRNFALKGAPLEFPGLIHHLLKGTDNMTEDQKELFSKALTYGTMGASAYVLGYMGRQVIQRNDDGSIDIAGHHIGKNWLDHPIVENYISGATFGQYMDNNEGEQSAGTYISAFVRGDMEAVKKMPYTQALQYGFVSSLIQALGAKNKDKGVDIATNAWDKKIAGMFSPGFMIDLAKMQDEDIFGDPVKRKPTNLLEHFEMNIPGLRKNVPEKE